MKLNKNKNNIILILFALLPIKTFAQLDVGLEAAKRGSGLNTDVDFKDIIGNVLYWGALILGSLGVLGFVISGIIYVTSAGNDERMETAKRAMIYSIIGIVVGTLGFAAVNLILDVTGNNAPAAPPPPGLPGPPVIPV